MNDLLPIQDQGDEDDVIIRPGEAPPFLIPWCASCKDGVELFTIDAVTNVFRLGVQATCHGATQGIWVSAEDLLARQKANKPIVMFRRGTHDRVR